MLDDSVGKLKRLQADVAASLRDDSHTGGPTQATVPLDRAGRFLHFWGLVGRFFWRNRCQVRASALAYTTLLALVPLLAVSLTVASLVFDAKSDASRQKLTGMIERLVDNVAPTLGLSDADGSTPVGPPAPGIQYVDASASRRADVAKNILDFVGNIHFGTIGVTAMVGLIFVAISLLRTIEAAFNDIWGVAKGRGWFDSIILYWAAISLGPIVLLVATTSGYLNALSDQTSWVHQIPGASVLQAQLLPVVVVGLAFGAFYRVMPNTRVEWPAALMGGLVAGILWWLNNRLGVLYNTKVVTYSKIYGSLGAVPLFLLGLYFSWMIVLFGSQVAYVFQNRRAYLQERMAERVHHQAREFIALRFMAEISRCFVHQLPPPPVARLASDLAVPARLSSSILQSLTNAQLIAETTGSHPGFAPARPLDQITTRDVLRALRTGQGSDLPTASDPSRPIVQAEFAAILAAEESRSGRISLAELVQKLPATP
jgi:membrane protein